MASTAREGAGGGGRDRKGSTSSNPPPQPPKKAAPRPTPSPSQPPSPSSQKPLPGYLRPTISSSASQRPTFDTSSSKPALERRRSYNKPPSPAPATKILRTSSAAATKTPPSVKPAPLRASPSLSTWSAKAPAGSYLRSHSAKVSPSSSVSSLHKAVRKTGSRSVTSESSVEFEARDRDPLDHVIAVEDETRSDCDQHEAQSLPDISEMPDQEEKLGDPEMVVQEAVEAKNEDDVPPQEPSKAVVEEAEQVQEIEGNEGDQVPEPTVAKEESTEKHDEEIVETADHVNQGGGAEENATKEDSTEVDEKHVVVELEASTEGSKEGGEETSAAAVQVKIESPPPMKAERPAKQSHPGKKETQAYNDVIEATASKLIKENNRNKVRALAGAFDKVISLQDTTK